MIKMIIEKTFNNLLLWLNSNINHISGYFYF